MVHLNEIRSLDHHSMRTSLVVNLLSPFEINGFLSRSESISGCETHPSQEFALNIRLAFKVTLHRFLQPEEFDSLGLHVLFNVV